MILSDAKILEEIHTGNIVIRPFSEEHLGTNSYDVHLSKHLAVYQDRVLDVKRANRIERFEIPPEGYVLEANTLYLGATQEYTETHKYVPFIDGKSSVGRLGIHIHATAGKGDLGYKNTWTLEISVIQPVRVYPGMPIGQLIYFQVVGEVLSSYTQKKSAKYTQETSLPVESKLYLHFSSKTEDEHPK